jgi:acyl dehydratase
MRIVKGVDEVLALEGIDLGVSDWLEIDQKRIDLFADASGDHQWIHVDPERAISGPFGRTIAHGYLTLALVVPLLWQLVEFPSDSTTVNYGLNKVRFPSPVLVGSRVRLRASVASVARATAGLELVFDMTVDIEGSAKPACVAQAVYRHAQ